MTKAHYKLDIDTRGALRYELNLHKLMGGNPERSHWLWWPNKLNEVFNQHWLDYLTTKHLTPLEVLIFYKSPNHNTTVFSSGIHIDSVPIEEYKRHKLQDKAFVHYGINLLGNPGHLTGNGYDIEYKDWRDNGVMRWYNHTNTEADKVLKYRTPAGQSYGHRECHPDMINDLNDVQEDCNHATLVNTSLPHEVETFDKPRLCFSLRCFDQLERRRIADWQDVANFFNEYNLIVE
tara:strand:- start:355 stop:1056 length:702 start_codon:yes stop_codon:yes gene_type:complete